MKRKSIAVLFAAMAIALWSTAATAFKVALGQLYGGNANASVIILKT